MNRLNDSLPVRVTSRMSVVTLAIAASCGLGRIAAAQGPDSLATVTTDTGRFAPGRIDLTRYSTPGLCVTAVLGARDAARRTLETQIQLYLLQGPVFDRDKAPAFRDTMPTAAVALARQCGAKFTLENIAARDLRDFFTLSLLQQNDGRATAALNRQVATAKTEEERREILLSAVREYLAAEPARTAAAEALVIRLDSIAGTGNIARLAQVEAQWDLLRVAEREFDRPRMRREAERMIAIVGVPKVSEFTSDNGRIIEGLRAAYGTLMALALADTPDSMTAVAARFFDFLQKDVPSGPKWLSDRAITNVQDMVRQLSPLTVQLDSLRGTAVPPLRADRWFPSKSGGQSTAKSTTWPISGALSLLVTMRSGRGAYENECHDYNVAVTPYGGYWGCFAVFTHIRQWARDFGAAGLQITAVTGTSGSLLFNGPQTTAEEVETIRWYFQDFLELPATIAVQERPLSARPAPDLRIGYAIAPFDSTYHKANYVLADAKGKMLYIGNDASLVTAVLARETAHNVTRDSAREGASHNVSPVQE